MVSKKGASSSSSNHQFQVGDVVLAKIKGFPAWPGILVGPSQTPREVLKEKPKDKFVIRFFPKADYHFPGAKDLTLLSREDCRAYAEDSHRKDGELKAAYKIGSDPAEWVKETDKIVRESEKIKEQEELEAREYEDELKDEDQEDSKPSSHKKRSAAEDAKSASKAKKAKTEGKEGSASAPRKSAAGASVNSAADSSSATGAGGEESEDMKKVRAWRHVLQRAFLPKDRLPTAGDLEGQGDIFTTVEKAEITADQLRETKIGKVMRKIVGLEKIPLDETYHFRERAEALINKWNNASAGGNGTSAEVKPPAADEVQPKEEPEEKPDAGADAAADAQVDSTEQVKTNGGSNGDAASAETNGSTTNAQTSVSESRKNGEEEVGDLTKLPEDA